MALSKGQLVIRSWMVKRRFQNAVMNSHHFMMRHDHREGEIEPARGKPLAGSRPGPTCEQLRQLLKARRARANFFGAHLFADPAWDILLMAYVALLEGERLLVSELCRESVVPATTTLRWVKALEQDGWLTHHSDQRDVPKSWLEMSAAGKLGMEQYLASFWLAMPV